MQRWIAACGLCATACTANGSLKVSLLLVTSIDPTVDTAEPGYHGTVGFAAQLVVPLQGDHRLRDRRDANASAVAACRSDRGAAT
jgi:hypothetical protein